jgi:hypothetical protein
MLVCFHKAKTYVRDGVSLCLPEFVTNSYIQVPYLFGFLVFWYFWPFFFLRKGSGIVARNPVPIRWRPRSNLAEGLNIRPVDRDRVPGLGLAVA